MPKRIAASHIQCNAVLWLFREQNKQKQSCTELLRCCCPYLNNSSPIFPYIAINEDPEEEEEEEDPDYSFPLSSVHW